MQRTAPKLTGAFQSGFWDALVFQASSTEPAILHAALALGAAHKKEVLRIRDGTDTAVTGKPLDERELFTIREYSKAINNVQGVLSVKGDASFGVALITCLLFTCMEFLRGYYKAGMGHLRSGLRLINELQTQASLKAHRETIDPWIFETFNRLNIQQSMLGSGFQYIHLASPTSEVDLPRLFLSANHARQHLERLMSESFRISEQCRGQEIAPRPLELTDSALQLQSDFRAWLRVYRASKTSLQSRFTSIESFAFRMLRLYHTMATIMADTCLLPPSEMVFDNHTTSFLSVITQSINLWNFRLSASIEDPLFPRPGEKNLSISDIGWLPPLYYTALKCRIHRIRAHAIKLLETVNHKEGIWSAKLVTTIARQVMLIEEQDFYKDSPVGDDFPRGRVPRQDDLSLPILPDSHRLHDVQISLPDDPFGKALITCRRLKEDYSWDIAVKEYDLPTRTWADVDISQV